MTDKVRVSTEILEGWAHELNAIQNAIAEAERILSGVSTAEKAGGTLQVDIHAQLNNGAHISGKDVSAIVQTLRSSIQRTDTDAEEISKTIIKAARLFEQAERKNEARIDGVAQAKGDPNAGSGEGAGFLSSVWDAIQWMRDWVDQQIQNIVTDPFDSWGKYGGDQGDIVTDFANHKKYREIIERNTGRKLTNAEFRAYLKRMSNEGCGYIAICNAIFAAYKGNAEGFKERFGFDMYKGADLNYNELFVDLYSNWDNKNTSGEFDNYGDYDSEDDGDMDGYDYWKDTTGNGTQIDWRSEIAVQYLEDHGVTATSESHSEAVLTADMYNEMVNNSGVERGQVQIRMSGQPAYLYDEHGNVAATYKGGHAMTVTGTTGSGENAMLIVSSWGKTYYIKPSDFCAVDENGDATGTMGYMVLDISA